MAHKAMHASIAEIQFFISHSFIYLFIFTLLKVTVDLEPIQHHSNTHSHTLLVGLGLSKTASRPGKALVTQWIHITPHTNQHHLLRVPVSNHEEGTEEIKIMCQELKSSVSYLQWQTILMHPYFKATLIIIPIIKLWLQEWLFELIKKRNFI